MRPEPGESERELYECFDCSRRVETPDTRVCENCGGQLRRIGRSRDL